MKIGILIIATNKYISFVEPLIASINKNFLPSHERNIFVFTDHVKDNHDNVKYIYEEHKPWPCMTLFRYSIFRKNEELFKDMDYIYYIDADMRVMMPVGDEILGELVAVQHFGYYNKPRYTFTFDTNPNSLAYMGPNDGTIYYAGAVQGGATQKYMSVVKTLAERIDDDYRRGVVALWHDESHWNKYLAFNPPSKMMSVAYCYSEGWNLPFEQKIVSLRKNEKELKV